MKKKSIYGPEAYLANAEQILENEFRRQQSPRGMFARVSVKMTFETEFLPITDYLTATGIHFENDISRVAQFFDQYEFWEVKSAIKAIRKIYPLQSDETLNLITLQIEDSHDAVTLYVNYLGSSPPEFWHQVHECENKFDLEVKMPIWLHVMAKWVSG